MDIWRIHLFVGISGRINLSQVCDVHSSKGAITSTHLVLWRRNPLLREEHPIELCI